MEEESRRHQAGSRGARENDADGETVELGGLPFRWPFGERRLLPALPDMPWPRLPPGVALRAAAISLVVGLVIGVGIGHFAIGPAAGKRPLAVNSSSSRTIEPQSVPTTVVDMTGARCAVQVGKNLQLGIQLINVSDGAVTLGQISTIFPIGGLKQLSGGVGACGALTSLVQPSPLPPSSTEWIVATVAVNVSCPQPYPVWFKINFSVGGKKSAVVIAAFPDLGQVQYGHCATSSLQSAWSPTREIVDSASGHSYGG